MGSLQSKSPLERRNTIARRSQRRTLGNLKPKIAKINKDIKKFKGINEADSQYSEIKREIEILKNELARRGRDLQPQIRGLYETVYKSVNEAELALQAKMEENKEKRDRKLQSDEPESSVVSEGHDFDVTSDISQADTIVQIHGDNQQNGGQGLQERRKSVQLKVVKVASDDDPPLASPTNSQVSAFDKRKSILKVGVAVMPGAVLNELAKQPNRLTKFYDLEDKPKKVNISERINEITEDVGQIENEIANFIGAKDGVQYTKFSNVLDKYLNELQSMSPDDEYIGDQLSKTINYIYSCVRFLEERASQPIGRRETLGSDDVFDNNVVDNVPLKLQKIMRSTAV
ncbi:hypothetical protein GWI33_016088 [Rhynchophorus ferrugineus]|uniref:Uncharacterized protein n=1 Tax=Rhynchophorus ferrugineus TaxID=354439 RepID=A0A834M7G5_RHYFE|nr:hypothetical protein GWI33_016088 [Rhynchophorus ferrugineus]